MHAYARLATGANACAKYPLSLKVFGTLAKDLYF